MAKRLHQVALSTRRRIFPLVILKINRSALIFVHLALSDACNNQCFINSVLHFVILTNYERWLRAIFCSRAHLARSGIANQNTGFTSSCPLAEPAI